MELSDTKSQDRFSMTDTVNSEDLNERIQEIIRQHYGQKELSTTSKNKSITRLSSSNKKRILNSPQTYQVDCEDNLMFFNKKCNANSLSPNNQKSQRNTAKNIQNSEVQNKNEEGYTQNGAYSPNNNSLMKYSPSTQAYMVERSDLKEVDYIINNSGFNYQIPNGFSSNRQSLLETSAIHEDQNESDQTIIYNQNKKQSQSVNGQNAQNSPAFSKSLHSEVGFYKTFNEEDSQTDIKNLINKLDKKNQTLTNLTNTSYSFLNNGSASKTNQNQLKNSKQEQQLISQFSQQNLSEILPNQLYQSYQQQSNLPYLLKQQKEYESIENINRMAAQTQCIKSLEESQLFLQDSIKKLTIKQLNAIKMMVKPLDCVQQITISLVSLIKDGRRIMESFDNNKQVQNTDNEENLELKHQLLINYKIIQKETQWKTLQEYFASPGRLMNELSRISDIIEMGQVSLQSISQCKKTIEHIQELKISDNPVLEEQMSMLFNYIKSVVSYHDLKIELNRLKIEEEQAVKKQKAEILLRQQQQLLQKENINQQQNFKKQINISNFSSKSSKDKNQGANLSRKQSHDRQSNMTFGNSVCSDTNRKEKNTLYNKFSSSSLVNFQNSNNSLKSSQQNSVIDKTPLKSSRKNLNTQQCEQSMKKRLNNSSSHKEILGNPNKFSKLEKNERSLSKSSSHKLERELRASDLLSDSSRSGINLQKQVDLLNPYNKDASGSQKSIKQNTLRSRSGLNSQNSSISSHQQSKDQLKKQLQKSPVQKQDNIQSKSNLQKSVHQKSQQLDKQNNKQSQSSLLQQSTQSSRSIYSTQFSDDLPQNKQNLVQKRQISRSNSNKRVEDSVFQKNKNQIELSPKLHQKEKSTNSIEKESNMIINNQNRSINSRQNKSINQNQDRQRSQSSNRERSLSQNRQRSSSQSSRNSTSQKDLKSRNQAAANSKISRLDKILNLKVKKPDANSCVRNMINNFEEFSQRTNSIDDRTSRSSSQVSRQKLQVQKQISQERQDILNIQQKKSKLESYIHRDNKLKIEQAQQLDEKLDNKWKSMERERLHGFLDEQKRREKQLLKEMNQETIQCTRMTKQLKEWDEFQFQNYQQQQNFINHLYTDCQKDRSKREESDVLNYKKNNLIEERHHKSVKHQQSHREQSINYQESDLKRLNNDLTEQQKRKRDLEDTLERTLDVIYNYRKMAYNKQLQ